MIPGEIITVSDGAALDANVGLATAILDVTNTGDRPIQVGSHYHFFETNDALRFDRAAAGDSKRVELVALAGTREVYGLNAKINGRLDRKVSAKSSAKAKATRRR